MEKKASKDRTTKGKFQLKIINNNNFRWFKDQ